ncbi:MAG: hypothetical protein HYX89_00730 [Chloroflexi bacterium]|nr:hypothetical protein [Chloroflexota bacterium]
MNVLRCTVVEGRNVVSFVVDCEALPALVAACAEDPRSFPQLLASLARYDWRVEEYVASGLAVFDELNGEGDYEVIHEALCSLKPFELPVFRVVDEETRSASLEPVKAGIVILNLIDRRIVQILDSYQEVHRKGRVRRSTGGFQRYELPSAWTVVP